MIMKNFKDAIGWILILPVLLLASCGQHYSNDISSRLKAQSCNYLPIDDSLVALDTAGLVHIEATAGNPLVCDSVYVVGKTWWQAWQDRDARALFIGSMLVSAFLIIMFIIKGNNPGREGRAILLWPGAAIVAFGIGAAAFSWSKSNSDREIRKADYIEYIQRDGDLHNFWITPAKHY